MPKSFETNSLDKLAVVIVSAIIKLLKMLSSLWHNITPTENVSQGCVTLNNTNIK